MTISESSRRPINSVLESLMEELAREGVDEARDFKAGSDEAVSGSRRLLPEIFRRPHDTHDVAAYKPAPLWGAAVLGTTPMWDQNFQLDDSAVAIAVLLLGLFLIQIAALTIANKIYPERSTPGQLTARH